MTNGVAPTSIDAVVLGLQQLNLDISDGERILSGIGVGEVGQRCAYDGDCDQCDAQENRGQFLLYVLSLLK